LEKIIKQRSGKKTIGFKTEEEVAAKPETENLLKTVETEDLLRFGIIPEFIGRVPVIATLENLSQEALVEVLTKPKNALVKQYRHLLRMEGADLIFTDEALVAIAEKALEKKTGARGLRAIIENCMLEVMYEVPSSTTIKEVVITPESIREDKKPVVVHRKEAVAS